jgi:hypothetical protein
MVPAIRRRGGAGGDGVAGALVVPAVEEDGGDVGVRVGVFVGVALVRGSSSGDPHAASSDVRAAARRTVRREAGTSMLRR